MKVKPIGLRDVEQISLENKVLYFPNDFVDTPSYLKQLEIEVYFLI